MNAQEKGVNGTLHAEYVRSLNCNYERILLDKKPEEKRYQYCILSRGGIKGLLSCSLRYINGMAYLYYDISSRQSVTQLYGNRCIDRAWVRDFLWSVRQVRQELERFLLDSGNVIWRPEHIFQDPESNAFSFLYVPYYQGEPGYMRLMEFLLDRIDYDDETLVECVYGMYEQLERNGEAYLQAQIYEDVKKLEKKDSGAERKEQIPTEAAGVQTTERAAADDIRENGAELWNRGTGNEIGEDAGNVSDKRRTAGRKTAGGDAGAKGGVSGRVRADAGEERIEKRGFFGLFESRKRKEKEQREEYRKIMQESMAGYAVAEETEYEADGYGRTVYVEESREDSERPHRLLGADGKLLGVLDKPVYVIGKKKEEADLVLEHPSVSRIHARIVRDKGDIYLEDLNSTNGTYKNGLRMQPYEKRRLEEGDEIRCGTVVLSFR